LYLPTVDEGENQPVGEKRSKFFNKIERQSRSARAIAMKKAYLWVKADGFEGGTAIMCHERVQERKQRIDLV
jgi:hypothetical protein